MKRRVAVAPKQMQPSQPEPLLKASVICRVTSAALVRGPARPRRSHQAPEAERGAVFLAQAVMEPAAAAATVLRDISGVSSPIGEIVQLEPT